MSDNPHEKIVRFAPWMSMFNFETPAMRLHEISWIEADPEFDVSFSGINRLLFGYVTGGSGQLGYKNAEHTLKRGDAFIVDMNESLELKCLGGKWNFLWIQMSSSLAYDAFTNMTKYHGHVFSPGTDVPLLCDHIFKVASGKWSYESDIELSSSLYRLLGLLITSTGTSSQLEDVLLYIKEHYSEKISVEDLARISCMSLSHFIRCFRDQFGTTPLEYVNEYRIRQAQQILITSDMPISMVASTVGFDNPSYFTELFKKITGCLPREHRNMYHGNPGSR